MGQVMIHEGTRRKERLASLRVPSRFFFASLHLWALIFCESM
jgi:hypothetical protein